MPLAFARSVLTGGNSKSFTLTRSAASVNEGASVTFTLNSSGLNGESVPYAITGISSADLSSGDLTGNIVINSDETGSASVTLANDFSTEGTETMTFTVGEAYQQYADENGFSTSVTVNDTSVSPSVSAVTRGASSVNEGSTVGISVTTSNLGNAKRIYYKLTGIQTSDISSVTTGSPNTGPVTYSSGSMTTEAGYITTNSSGTGNLRITTAADELTEGAQTITFTVTRLADGSGTTLATDGSSSTTITINDTSITHPTGQFFVTPGSSVQVAGSSNYSNSFAGNNFNPNYSVNKTNANTNVQTVYNWSIPSGVTDIAVVCVGAGGAGPFGSQNAYSGGGGGGGGLAASTFVGVTPGSNYQLRVGKAGNTGKASGDTQFASSNQSGYNSVVGYAGKSPGIVASNSPANLGGLAQSTDSQSNSNNGRIGGTYYFSNALTSGVSRGNHTSTTMHRGQGGAGGRGFYFNNSQRAGGGGGAGGWGRANFGQTGFGGQGGAGNQGGNSGNNGAGGGGGSGNSYGGQGGGVGLDPGNTSNQSASGGGTGQNGSQGCPWQGYEYGYGGGAGSPNQNGVSGGCGAIRIIWTSGAKFQ